MRRSAVSENLSQVERRAMPWNETVCAAPLGYSLSGEEACLRLSFFIRLSSSPRGSQSKAPSFPPCLSHYHHHFLPKYICGHTRLSQTQFSFQSFNFFNHPHTTARFTQHVQPRLLSAAGWLSPATSAEVSRNTLFGAMHHFYVYHFHNHFIPT